ncbi:hypothetical protein MKEN_01151400 [Mycena kentingensis (nom. inval.)]|nr:hypothetical protein MKEN_01151400 [Mycena kentingensis (nom. inval.)]
MPSSDNAAASSATTASPPPSGSGSATPTSTTASRSAPVLRPDEGLWPASDVSQHPIRFQVIVASFALGSALLCLYHPQITIVFVAEGALFVCFSLVPERTISKMQKRAVHWALAFPLLAFVILGFIWILPRSPLRTPARRLALYAGIVLAVLLVLYALVLAYYVFLNVVLQWGPRSRHEWPRLRNGGVYARAALYRLASLACTGGSLALFALFLEHESRVGLIVLLSIMKVFSILYLGLAGSTNPPPWSNNVRANLPGTQALVFLGTIFFSWLFLLQTTGASDRPPLPDSKRVLVLLGAHALDVLALLFALCCGRSSISWGEYLAATKVVKEQQLAEKRAQEEARRNAAAAASTQTEGVQLQATTQSNAPIPQPASAATAV